MSNNNNICTCMYVHVYSCVYTCMYNRTYYVYMYLKYHGGSHVDMHEILQGCYICTLHITLIFRKPANGIHIVLFTIMFTHNCAPHKNVHAVYCFNCYVNASTPLICICKLLGGSIAGRQDGRSHDY